MTEDTVIHIDSAVINVLGPTAEDIHQAVATALTPLENRMTEISQFLDAQNATVDAITNQLTDVAADIAVLLAAVPAGTFSADEQAKADTVATKLAAVSTALGALDVAVGDQDGSDTPADPPVEG